MDTDSRLNEEKNNGILAIRKAQQIAEKMAFLACL